MSLTSKTENNEKVRKRAGGNADMTQTICFCCPAAGYLQGLGTLCLIIGIVRVVLFAISSDDKKPIHWFSMGIESIILGLVILFVVWLESRCVFVLFGILALAGAVYTGVMTYMNREVMKKAFEQKEAMPIVRVVFVFIFIIVLLISAYASLSLGILSRSQGGADDRDTVEIKWRKRESELSSVISQITETTPEVSLTQIY